MKFVTRDRVRIVVRRSARPVLIAATALVAVIALSHGSGQASTGRTVTTRGGESFVPNAKIMATLRFSPGNISIASGETLTLVKDDGTEEPHTLSIVNANEVPGDIDAVFNCGSPDTVCDDVFSQFSGDPTSPVFLNASGTGAGIDGRLDTLVVLAPGDTISAPVTAPAGSKLYYICAIHAWMQGTINVK